MISGEWIVGGGGGFLRGECDRVIGPARGKREIGAGFLLCFLLIRVVCNEGYLGIRAAIRLSELVTRYDKMARWCWRHGQPFRPWGPFNLVSAGSRENEHLLTFA